MEFVSHVDLLIRQVYERLEDGISGPASASEGILHDIKRYNPCAGM